MHLPCGITHALGHSTSAPTLCSSATAQLCTEGFGSFPRWAFS